MFVGVVLCSHFVVKRLLVTAAMFSGRYFHMKPCLLVFHQFLLRRLLNTVSANGRREFLPSCQ